MTFSIKHTLLLILLALGGSSLLAQSKQGQALIDSLLTELPEMKEDTNKAKALNTLSSTFYSIDPEKGIQYGFQTAALAKKINWKKGIGHAYLSLGANYWSQGNYPKALEYFLKALRIYEGLSDKQGITRSTGNIGVVYYEQGNYPKALEYFLKALQINEKLGNKYGIASNTGNIGNVYNDQGNYPKALEYYLKALQLYEALGDKQGIARNTGNIGSVYNGQGDYPKALEYFLKALRINEELDNKQGIAGNTGHIGNTYKDQGNYLKALEYYLKALRINEELGDEHDIAINTGTIGATYLRIAQDHKTSASDQVRELRKAISYLETSNRKSLAIGDLENYQLHAKNLSEAYALNGNYKKALETFREHSRYKDSISNEENLKKQTQLETRFEMEKEQEKTKQLEAQQLAKEQEQLQRKANIQYMAIALGVLIVFVCIVVLGRTMLPIRIVEEALFLAFLLLFEFILLIADPVFVRYTGGTPLPLLALNVGLAVLFTPFHGWLEGKLKSWVNK